MLRKLIFCQMRIVKPNEMHQGMRSQSIKENDMWTKPAATEMRFGFEVTMYVMNK
jgi:pyrroloquinoline quinone biosynthesis protein A